mgnify:CR=1 FL=1
MVTSEHRLPRIWKLASICPVCQRRKIVNDLIKKELRPIPLTSCISKVAEECVVADYVKAADFAVLHLNQYGAVPKLSNTRAFKIDMVHNWAKGTD